MFALVVRMDHLVFHFANASIPKRAKTIDLTYSPIHYTVYDNIWNQHDICSSQIESLMSIKKTKIFNDVSFPWP